MPQTLPALIALLLIPFTLRAQDPWATNVVSYVQGSAPAIGYTDSQQALGRPTVMTYADFSESEPSVVVVPVYPPWDVFELVSIGEGGELILQMGKPITNDPANPYGVDLLVFGNALMSGGGAYDVNQNTPLNYTLSDPPSLSDKWGVVSVSDDGITWFSFPEAQRVGSLMPTLGKIWTGSDWGADTDPTIPPDPSLTLSDLGSMKLEDLCIRYRGGAGGTGFDLEDLVIPEGVTPPASFTYVKISVPDDGDAQTNRRTEIDAVTVVSPVEGFTRWQQAHFSWTGDPALESPSANEDGDAFDNWQEFARGGDPDAADAELPVPELTPSGTTGFSLSLPGSAVEAPWTLQFTSTPEDAASWTAVTPSPVSVDTPSGEDVIRTYSVPAPENGATLYRLMLEEAP